MNLSLLPLVNWTAGIVTAIVFIVVSLGLVVALLLFMFGGKKKE